MKVRSHMTDKIKGWVLGVDPGQEGAIACLPIGTKNNVYNDFVQIYTIPFTHDKDGNKEIDSLALDNMCRDISQANILQVVVEDQWSRPGHSIKAAQKLGENFGKLKSALERFFTRKKLLYVAPTTWQSKVRKPVYCGEEGGNSKAITMKVVKSLYPEVNVGGNHNKADALLIATYWLVK